MQKLQTQLHNLLTANAHSSASAITSYEMIFSEQFNILIIKLFILSELERLK